MTSSVAGTSPAAGAVTPTRTAPSPHWQALVDTYRRMRVVIPALKGITLAQWALESSWGTSPLAIEHNNFAGMGFRWVLWRYARPITRTTSDGEGTYCHFHNLEAFIRGYWRFLARSRYEGWRAHEDDPEAFLRHLSTRGYATEPTYVERVMRVYRWMQAQSVL